MRNEAIINEYVECIKRHKDVIAEAKEQVETASEVYNSIKKYCNERVK